MSERAELIPHSAAGTGALRRMATTLERDAASGALVISWRLEGDIAALRLPEQAAPLRADGLWQHSCFEVFLRADDKDCYLEFNFSPTGAWAGYRFDSRRSGRTLPVMTAPRIETVRDAGAFALTAVVAPGGISELAQAAKIHAGLAAVIEDARGALGYWALAHAGPQPDFHDPATFTLVLGGA